MDAKALQRLVSEVARRELGEDEATRAGFVRQFREWLETNPDIQNYKGDDVMALLYLRKGKYSIARAQELFLKTQHLRNTFPHVMGNTDVLDPKVNIFAKNGFIFMSPVTDDHGRHTVIIQISKIDPSKCEYTDYMKALVGTALALKNEVVQVLGVVYVVNMSNISPALLTQMPLTEYFAFTREIIQNASPLSYKAFHFINMPTAVRWFFDIMVSHASDKMKKRFMAHATIEDFHKHVNPKVLPKEYGGKMTSQAMIDLSYQELLAARDTVTNWNSIRLVQPDDGSLKTAIAQLPGTFRKLEVD